MDESKKKAFLKIMANAGLIIALTPLLLFLIFQSLSFLFSNEITHVLTDRFLNLTKISFIPGILFSIISFWLSTTNLKSIEAREVSLMEKNIEEGETERRIYGFGLLLIIISPATFIIYLLLGHLLGCTGIDVPGDHVCKIGGGNLSETVEGFLGFALYSLFLIPVGIIIILLTFITGAIEKNSSKNNES